jgi:hypothetical protein
MWARIAELLLGGWLIASPFVLSPERQLMELLCGSSFIVLAALSFTQRWRTAHRLSIVIALVLASAAYFGASYPPSAAQQNDIITGLLVLMFAIVPSEASLPPRSWRSFHTRRPVS